jgi:hypothetical protein
MHDTKITACVYYLSEITLWGYEPLLSRCTAPAEVPTMFLAYRYGYSHFMTGWRGRQGQGTGGIRNKIGACS